MKTFIRSLFVLALGATTIWSFLVGDAQGFQHPAFARIFFWHFPGTIMLLGFMFAGIYFSFRVFRRVTRQGFPLVEDPDERRQWDVRAESAMELGFLFAVLTMLSGILFSVVQWGAWWQWDPRQSSFLLALLIYAAYFALRNGFSDPEKRAAYSAIYAISSALPILFLVVVFPRLPPIAEQSFHPTNTIMDGQLKGAYAYVTIVMLCLISVLSVWLYSLRSAAGLLEIALERASEKIDGTLETDRINPAPSGVVRPVAVPPEG